MHSTRLGAAAIAFGAAVKDLFTLAVQQGQKSHLRRHKTARMLKKSDIHMIKLIKTAWS
jgi:hypothetical protein